MATTRNKADYHRLMKLLGRMCEELKHNRLDGTITSRISDFWYMQRLSELEVLEDQLKRTLARAGEIQRLMEICCRETGRKYQKDIRWLKKYKATRKPKTKQEDPDA